MTDRGELITLIGSYGKLVARGSGSTPEANIAAMKAIEDFCDAAVLAERNACAEIVVDNYRNGGHSLVAQRMIRERPAP